MVWKSVNPHNLDEVVPANVVDWHPTPSIHTYICTAQPHPVPFTPNSEVDIPRREAYATIFSRLPTELRTMVFQIFCGEGLAVGVENGVPFRSGNYYGRLFLCRLVCWEWEKFILDCRTLWRYACEEDHPAITEKAVPLAKGTSMVKDRWRTKARRAGLEPIWEKISQTPAKALFFFHDQRIQEGSIDPVVKSLEQDSYDQLKTAWIIVRHGSHAPKLTLFGNQPHLGLVELTVHAKVRLSIAPNRFPSLLRLSISGSPAVHGALPKVHELLAAVGQMGLRELTLHEYDCRIDSKKLRGFHPVRLPHLQHLVIAKTPLGVIRQFLAGLDTPSCIVTELSSDGRAGVGDQVGSDMFMEAYAGYIGRTLATLTEPTSWTWKTEMLGFDVGGRSFSFSRRFTDVFTVHSPVVISQRSRDLESLFAHFTTLTFIAVVRVVSLVDVNGGTFTNGIPLAELFPNLEEIQIVGGPVSMDAIHTAIFTLPPTFLSRASRLRLLIADSDFLDDDFFRMELREVLEERPQLVVVLDASACRGDVDPTPWNGMERIQLVLPTPTAPLTLAASLTLAAPPTPALPLIPAAPLAPPVLPLPSLFQGFNEQLLMGLVSHQAGSGQG